MKRNHLLYCFFALLLCISGLFISCSEDEDCSMTARPYAVCKFYEYGASKKIVRAYTLPQLSVISLEPETTLLNRDENVTEWNQALYYNTEQTSFVLIYGDPNDEETLRDTITVNHLNSFRFISVECGYQSTQEITSIESYTTHKLDSISLINKEANTNGRENIRIIF